MGNTWEDNEKINDRFIKRYQSVLASVKEIDKMTYEKLTPSAQQRYKVLNGWFEMNEDEYFTLINITGLILNK